ncbi:MAG: redox-regulated ATPase YchF [Oscillospiraceae bacterium]|nr:redox-regulated ATPase YchF [Oscillospiraceae bacterium]
MKIGIVGLPNTGKSTLFNALTGASAAAENYPFCTIEPNKATVPVPDERLDYLGMLYHPRRVVPAVIEFVDIAGLVAGASKGEGLGNKFLSHIREVDAVLHVTRCFEGGLAHIGGPLDPVRDIETVELELVLSDIEIAERRIARVSKALKGDKGLEAELRFLQKLLDWLEKGKNAREIGGLSQAEQNILNGMNLLSNKPVIYAANLSDDCFFTSLLDDANYLRVAELAAARDSGVIAVCARAEQELSQLDGKEREEFLLELGIQQGGLHTLIRESYKLLGLISFFTIGEDEVRAWTIPLGIKAPQAAGKIHTDFQRGFIRAEVVPFGELKACGSMALSREKGLIRSEGKEYVVRDGDVVLFRFNV